MSTRELFVLEDEIIQTIKHNKNNGLFMLSSKNLDLKIFFNFSII